MKYYTPISFASSSGDNESTRVFFSLFVSLSLSFFLSSSRFLSPLLFPLARREAKVFLELSSFTVKLISLYKLFVRGD